MANWESLRIDPVQYLSETNKLVSDAQDALRNSARPYTHFLEELEACIDKFPNTPERESGRSLLHGIMDDLFIASVSQNTTEIAKRADEINDQAQRLAEITSNVNRSAALIRLQPVIDVANSLMRIIQEISDLKGKPDASIATSAGHIIDEVSALAMKLSTVVPIPNVDFNQIRTTVSALGHIADEFRGIAKAPNTLNTTAGTLVRSLTDVHSGLVTVVNTTT